MYQVKCFRLKRVKYRGFTRSPFLLNDIDKRKPKQQQQQQQLDFYISKALIATVKWLSQ